MVCAKTGLYTLHAFVHIPHMIRAHGKLERPANYPTHGVRWFWLFTACLVAITLLVYPFDTRVAGFNRFGEIPGDLRRVLQLSEIFAHGFGVALVAIGIWVLAKEQRPFIPRVVVCAVWPGLIVHGVKMVVARVRPGKIPSEFPDSSAETWLGVWPFSLDQLNSLYDAQAFPSAHTATAVGLAIGLCWLFPRGKYLFLTLAGLAALQRIEAGAHWLSDIMAGAAIATMAAGAITQNWGFGRWLGAWEEHCLESRSRRLCSIAGQSGTCDVEAGESVNVSAKQVA